MIPVRSSKVWSLPGWPQMTAWLTFWPQTPPLCLGYHIVCWCNDTLWLGWLVRSSDTMYWVCAFTICPTCPGVFGETQQKVPDSGWLYCKRGYFCEGVCVIVWISCLLIPIIFEKTAAFFHAWRNSDKNWNYHNSVSFILHSKLCLLVLFCRCKSEMVYFNHCRPPFRQIVTM